MSTIRCIYTALPAFPATDQHPDAVRYHVGELWVDAIGGAPSPDEIDAVLNATPVDSDIKQLRDLLVSKNVITSDDAAALSASEDRPAGRVISAKAIS